MSYVTQSKQGEERNRLYEEDLPVHEWYRFVLSYPPHLVRSYVEAFDLGPGQRLLDPFCGTGTTLVEGKKLGLESIGLEANPVVQFAARVKTDWCVDPDFLDAQAASVAEAARGVLAEDGIRDEPLFRPLDATFSDLRTVDAERQRLLIKNSISPLPLHKVLVLQEAMHRCASPKALPYLRLALAKELVASIGNLRFGPEVGVGTVKDDAPVVVTWHDAVRAMARDLRYVHDAYDEAPATVLHTDARALADGPARRLAPASIDAVITSPPYPNEKDYSRTTRLESVLLGFMRTRKDLRRHKKRFIRSNTRGVYKADTDDAWIEDVPRVQDLADAIEAKRVELGKTSGFERTYHRVVRLYFGGMARHLDALKPLLKPGARLAYVVGDQASYFRIMIRTGDILARLAERLGYEVLDIDLFRTRFSTATKRDLREEVVVLKWNG
jgi:DNA modification methylase